MATRLVWRRSPKSDGDLLLGQEMAPRRVSVSSTPPPPYARWRAFACLVIALVLGYVVGRRHPIVLSVYTRRPPHARLLPPILPPALDAEELATAAKLGIDVPGDKVPNIVHYVYGLATPKGADNTTTTTKDNSGSSTSGAGEEFPYYAYLSMRSALTVLRPERILFHCLYEPTGYWWDRVRGWEADELVGGKKRRVVEVVPARDVVKVGRHDAPVYHFAHKADIIRLEVLQQYGGIYLDIDAFVIRSFRDAGLMSHDTVLGIEARKVALKFGRGSDDEMKPEGLTNAIIVARPDAPFINRWLEAYDTFNAEIWNEHSVVLPWLLTRLYPTEVTLLSDRAFFWPLWSHIAAVHDGTEYDFLASGQLAYHAWESMARDYLLRLDPSNIKRESSFNRMARRYCEEGEEERWVEWRRWKAWTEKRAV